MKGIYICGLLFFIGVCAHGQIANKEIDLGTFYPHNLDILAANDSSLCVYFKNPTTDKFKIIDKAGQLVRAVTYNNKDYEHGEKLPLLGKIATDSTFVFYFASKKGSLFLNMQSISRYGTADKRRENINLRTAAGDLLLYSIQNNDKYCVFTCDKSRQKLKLFVFSGTSEYKMYVYENVADLVSFYKSEETVLVNENSIKNIIAASKTQKIYNTDTNFLTLTWEKFLQADNTASTVLWQFDLNTGELKTHLFSGETVNSNSFYFDATLYKLTLLPEQFKLDLFNVNTEKLMHTYEYDQQQKLDLVYDEVLNDDAKGLTEPAQILKLLSQNYPAVSVSRANGDTLCLLIGSYPNKENKSTGIVVGTSTKSTTVSTPDGTTSLKLPSEFKLGDRNTYTRFSSLIRKSDFGIIHDYPGIPDFEKYNILTKSLKKSGVVYDYSIKFRIQQRDFFGYLPKNSTLLKIIQVQ